MKQLFAHCQEIRKLENGLIEKEYAMARENSNKKFPWGVVLPLLFLLGVWVTYKIWVSIETQREREFVRTPEGYNLRMSQLDLAKLYAMEKLEAIKSERATNDSQIFIIGKPIGYQPPKGE